MDLLHTPEFGARVGELLDKWHVPGLAVALVQDTTVTSRGFGSAVLDPPKPCTADSIFDIASSSKSLTAASIALLVADDEKHPDVQWDASMSSLLPDDFVMSEQYYTDRVTVEDVLSHRTGLPSHDTSYFGIRASKADNAESITRNLRNLQIAYPLRANFAYCNLMFTVASFLVEKVSGIEFPDFLSKHFFRPLGMNSTHLQPDAARNAGLQDRLAASYVWQEDKAAYKSIPLQQSPEGQGAGSIMTSANDYIKYLKAVMLQEKPFSEEIVKGLTKARILIPLDDEDTGPDPYASWSASAAGWWSNYYRGYQIVLHEGSISGFGSTHFFLPKQKFGGVVLGNASGASFLAPLIAYMLIDEALNVPQGERPDWDSIFEDKKSVENAMPDAEEMKKEICPEYDGTSQPQTTPLSVYTGTYWNVGYRRLTVGTQDEKLFVDAHDRAFGFVLKFEHVCEQGKYIAHLVDDFEGGDEPIKAEFKFENGRVTQLGLGFEDSLDDLIWFDRTD